MLKTLHPHTRQLIDYKEYKEFTIKNGYQTLKDAPSTKCPICLGNMIARAGQTKDDGHFAHKEDQPCPTKTPAARPYLVLHHTPIDPLIVKANKDFIKNNLDAIFTLLIEIAPYLDFKEFIKILEEAKRLNIYQYANLIKEYIPYVYVTLINFLPNKSFKQKRLYKFMFFYESNIISFSDLWIDNGVSSKLYRISYDGSTTKKVTEIGINGNYLILPTKTLSAKQKDWCNQVI